MNNKNDLKNLRGIVYKIVNIINNKVYIGSSFNSFYDRYQGGNLLNGVSNLHFKNAIKKYGIKNFRIEILYSGIQNPKELERLENENIIKNNSTNPLYGYNKKIKNHLTEESRRKISYTLGGGLIPFLKKCKEKHGDEYDYSKVEYTRAKNKVVIICKKHGEFQQIAFNHSKGDKCPKCMKHSSVGIHDPVKARKRMQNELLNHYKMKTANLILFWERYNYQLEITNITSFTQLISQ